MFDSYYFFKKKQMSIGICPRRMAAGSVLVLALC